MKIRMAPIVLAGFLNISSFSQEPHKIFLELSAGLRYRLGKMFMFLERRI